MCSSDLDFKGYRKQKQYNRNQQEIMKKLEFPNPESSEEVSENTYKSKNTYESTDRTNLET